MARSINQDLHDKIAKIDNYIGSRHDATCFIWFKVNNFELDTRDSDTFKHFAISLENQKTGVGLGNSFKITLAYHPQFSNESNINAFEERLSTLREACLDINNTSALQEIVTNRNTCFLKYGYITDNGDILETPEYTGYFLKYTVNANKQIVTYILEGTSGENVITSTVNWYPKPTGFEGESTDSETNIISAVLSYDKDNSTMSLAEINDNIKRLNESFGQSTPKGNPYDILDYFIYDYNNEMVKLSASNAISDPTKFRLVDNTGLDLKNNNVLEPVAVSLCRSQTAIEYIKYLVSMFSEKIDGLLSYYKQQKGIAKRWTVEFKKSTEEANTINVVLSCIEMRESDIYDYEFIGYRPNNNLLIDYNLNYDGTIALTVGQNMSEDNSSIYIDSRGQLKKKANITSDMFVSGAIDEVLIKEQNEWLDQISCANNCSMKTFGLPFEIPVGAVFNVGIEIDGKLHHSSGRCYVTGITDKIENGMFTTDFSMIRLPGRGNGVTN